MNTDIYEKKHEDLFKKNSGIDLLEENYMKILTEQYKNIVINNKHKIVEMMQIL